MRERRAWTDWIPTSSRSSCQSRSAILRVRVPFFQICRPSKFCCAEMVFPQPARTPALHSCVRRRRMCRQPGSQYAHTPPCRTSGIVTPSARLLALTIHEYLLRVRSSRPARLFSFGLLDGPQVRLRRPYLREAPAGFSLERLATAFMNNPG